VITLNGEDRADLHAPLSVRALLDALDVDSEARGVAVAVDAEVVPRAEWETHVVRDGDRVEVLIAVQGG
jgi:sulfur carrier protein